MWVSVMLEEVIGNEDGIQGKSGRVALVRTKLVPARPARREEAEPAARRAERAAELRSKVADIME